MEVNSTKPLLFITIRTKYQREGCGDQWQRFRWRKQKMQNLEREL